MSSKQRRAAALLVASTALLLALAGCLAPVDLAQIAATVTATGAVTEAPTRTPAVAAPTATRASGAVAPTPAGPLTQAQVLEIVDGDTIRVSIEGRRYSVRYIGINAPEVSHTGGESDPYGPEATELNRQLVEGREVLLESDSSDTDAYGRLLRYVWVDGTLVNGALVRAGLADARRYPPDTARQSWLQQQEDAARAEGLGLWSIAQATAEPSETAVTQDSAVVIAGVNRTGRPESVTITNRGAGTVSLAGWALVSVRGDQRYTFAEGTQLTAGASLTVYSGQGAGAVGGLLWTEEPVWNDSASDPAELWDAAGQLVDRVE